MDSMALLKGRIVNNSNSEIERSDDGIRIISNAMITIINLSNIAKDNGILLLDEAVEKLDPSIPLRGKLVELIKCYIDASGLDECIRENISSISKGLDMFLFYVYAYGTLDLQVLNIDSYCEEIMSLIPGDKHIFFNETFSAVKSENQNRLNDIYFNKYCNTIVYTDDTVLDSYIKATCKELNELTDKDILYVYEKSPEKFIEFMRYADSIYRRRIVNTIHTNEVKEYALECGKYFENMANSDGKVTFISMSKIEYLVMDIHDVIFKGYSDGELEGGSDIILHPDVKEREIKDKLWNMGF